MKLSKTERLRWAAYFVEPLRVQLAFGETVADGERELARLRWRFAAEMEGVKR